MDIKLILGSRSSELARIQTEIASKILAANGAKINKIYYINTSGDKSYLSLPKNSGGKGLFTKEIDDLIINEDIDIGIHSLKDIPGSINSDLIIGVVLPREDCREALITKEMKIKNIMDLPNNSLFASSSPRRLSYIKTIRPDLKTTNLRGNINTRINRINSGYAFATLLAMAGLNRLKLKNKINCPVPTSVVLPPAGQGVIALVHKKGNKTIAKLCSIIDDKPTRIAIMAERAFIKKINGNCNTPVSAYARVWLKTVKLETRLFSEDGKKYIDTKSTSHISNATELGYKCAKELLSNGGGKLINN